MKDSGDQAHYSILTKCEVPDRGRRRSAIVLLLLALMSINCWRVDRARYKETSNRLEEVGRVLERYRAEHGSYPSTAETDFPSLVARIDLKSDWDIHTLDAWGRPFMYYGAQAAYVLWSNGADGERDASPVGGPREGYEVDIVLHNNVFWQGRIGSAAIQHNWQGESPFRVVDRLRQGQSSDG